LVIGPKADEVDTKETEAKSEVGKYLNNYTGKKRSSVSPDGSEGPTTIVVVSALA
jgi:hypothetical protein